MGYRERPNGTMAVETREVVFARDVADGVVFMVEGMVEKSRPPQEVDAPQHAPILVRMEW